MTQFPHDARHFVADIAAWCRTGSLERLLRAFRSQFSGVPHDVGAAYATIAWRSGDLFESIAADRLALPPADRDAVFRFYHISRSLCDQARDASDDELALAARTAFGLGRETAPSADLPRVAGGELTLAGAPAPEAPAGVPGWTQHFSASALNMYAQCPRKWFYRYVCNAIEDRSGGAAAYGTAFHLALEEFHVEFPTPGQASAERMRAAIPLYVNTAFEKYAGLFDNSLERELQKRRARRTAQRYVDWLLSEAKRAPFTVIGRELEARLDMEGFTFVGYIDRLDRDDATGTTSVVDYKTGVIATNAREYRHDVLTFADFQLPFYYWARSAQGDRVTRLALIPLKDASLEVRPVSLDVVAVPSAAPRQGRYDASATGFIAVAELERSRARMIAICTELASGTVERFAVASDPDACRYCAYVNACAARPPRALERFGR